MATVRTKQEEGEEMVGWAMAKMVAWRQCESINTAKYHQTKQKSNRLMTLDYIKSALTLRSYS